MGCVASQRPALLDPGWRSIRAASPASGEQRARRRLTFLGHSTVLIEIDELRILTDPILRTWLGPVRRQVATVLPELFADIDVVFISHGHHDHLDLGSLRRIPGRPTVLVPRGMGRIAARAGLGPVEEVVAGDRLLIDRVHVEVVAARHSGRREPFGPDGDAIGCVVDGSAAVYFPGDTDVDPAMAELRGRLDVALMPMWGWGPRLGPGHMDPARAAAATALLEPRLVVPIHWGTLYPVGLRRLVRRPFDNPGPDFVRELARIAPGVPARILAPGEAHEIASRQAGHARDPGASADPGDLAAG
jgi:L-ascorbate metabolism protein UlaG (beta-lactamase superfamily)